MGILTNVFYLISTSLLIPIMLALLLCLARVLVLAGQSLREHLARARSREAIRSFSQALEDGSEWAGDLPSEGLVAHCLARLQAVADDDLLAEKVVRETELVWQADLDRLRGLSRFGPALGLMGTLVPLGPALVGLAAGDLQMMSNNLVIAFATTVVGLLIGTLATYMLGIKKRWYQGDALLVTFAANRLPYVATSSKADHESRDDCGTCSKEEEFAATCTGNGEK